MKILAIEKEISTTKNAFSPYLESEAKRVWELYESSVLREIYFREDEPRAVLVLECSGVEEAEAILATLPLVKKQMIAFDIVPLVPYTGLARLFKK